MKPKHTGTVKNGKLKLDNREFFVWDVQNFDGKDVELIIKGVRNTRSNRMNRFYWGVIIDTLVNYFNQEKTFGEVVSREAVHDLMKCKFLGMHRVFLPDGQPVDVVNSSRNLSNKEFIDYFEEIIRWADQHLSVHIPLPDEVRKTEKSVNNICINSKE